MLRSLKAIVNYFISFITLRFFFELAMSLTPLGQQRYHCFRLFNSIVCRNGNALIFANYSKLVVILVTPEKFGNSFANEFLAKVYWTGFTSNLE